MRKNSLKERLQLSTARYKMVIPLQCEVTLVHMSSHYFLFMICIDSLGIFSPIQVAKQIKTPADAGSKKVSESVCV